MNIFKLSILIITSFIVSTCSNDQALRAKANELAHKFIITDGHIDTPWKPVSYTHLTLPTKA